MAQKFFVLQEMMDTLFLFYPKHKIIKIHILEEIGKLSVPFCVQLSELQEVISKKRDSERSRPLVNSKPQEHHSLILSQAYLPPSAASSNMFLSFISLLLATRQHQIDSISPYLSHLQATGCQLLDGANLTSRFKFLSSD